MIDATAISSEYLDLISLVFRSTISALEITMSKNPDGNYNSSDIMVFLKDIGNIGSGGYVFQSQVLIFDTHIFFSVNSVEVLYASFPLYLYLNPAIGAYLLRPLLLAQDTPQRTQPYAAQNLGS